MRVKFIHWYNMLLTALISLLGFNSCNKSGESEEVPCEYGCPITEFKVKGTVTDTNGTPIEGIQVSVLSQQNSEDTDPVSLQTTTTLSDGTFTTEMMSKMSLNEVAETVKVKFEDIDDTANGGLFDSKTVSAADLTRTQTKEGDGGWFIGEFEYSGTISLSPLSK